MNKLITIFLGVLFLSINVKSQELPQVIPPSPSTQQFQKYVDYPVGSFTGVPDIQIPLYTVQSGDLSVPISLSYHASGCRPSNPNGFVGIGWTLQSGGKISRTVNGRADEVTYPPFNNATQLDGQLPDTRNYNLTDIQKQGDSEPDIFTYRFNGYSGKFILKRDAAKTPLLMPYKPLKFSNIGSGDIEVWDERGGKYVFAAKEFSENNNACTAWDISQMISATDPTNVINFQSSGGQREWANDYKEYAIIDDRQSTSGIWRVCWQDPVGVGGYKSDYDVLEHYNVDYTNENPNSYVGTVPGTITFRNGKVLFVINQTTNLLQKIEVYNKSDVLLKSIEFVYTAKNTLRFLLKQVKFFDSAHHFINQYQFDYDSENSELPVSDLCSTDYWGYFNGYPSGSGIGKQIPAWSIPIWHRPSVVIGSNTRITNEFFMKTFVLNKITYPTGGYTLYDYEANKSPIAMYPYSDYPGASVGGLRVKSITHYKSTNSVPEIRTYEYEQGHIDFVPGRIEDYSYSQQGFVWDLRTYWNSAWDSYRRRYYCSEPFINLAPHGSPVVYSRVTQYDGDITQNVGKTVYTYDYEPTEKTTYESNGTTDLEFGSIIYKQFLKPYKDWKSGNLVGTDHYKNVNGNYLAVSAEGPVYVDVVGEGVSGLKVDRYVTYTPDGCTSQPNWSYPASYDTYLSAYGVICAYNYGDYYIESGYRRLESTVKMVYDANGQNPVTTTTSYEYGNTVHEQPTKKTVTTSLGTDQVTTYKYPSDFSTMAPYDQMWNTLHMWSPVIEQEEYKGTTYLNSLKTEYSLDSGWPRPSVVSTKKAGSLYDPRVLFKGYDSQGNIKEVSKVGAPSISYLWGYNKTYPIAQVTGAAANEIYHANFEEDTDFPAQIYKDASVSHTGRYSGKIGNPGSSEQYYHSNTWLEINLQGHSKKFKFSGWVYSDGPTSELYLFMKRAGETGYFSYVDAVGTNQTGGWAYLEKEVEVPADVRYLNLRVDNNGGGNVWFDDLRLHPSDAQMTTYTYDQLVGMTSTTDVKNMPTHYEYDDFQRLRVIRDKDKKIVKTFCYNYQGQQADCFTGQATTPVQQTVYARIEISNYSNVYSGTSQDNYTETYGDVNIKFYSDPGCTVAAVLQAGMVVSVQDDYVWSDDFGTSTTTSVNNYTVPVGVSSYSLGRPVIFYEHASMDWYGDWHYQAGSSSLSVIAHVGSNYIPQ